MANTTIYPYGIGGQAAVGIDTVSQMINGKADKATTYTKTEVDQLVADAGKVKSVSINGGIASEPDANGNVDLTVEENNIATAAFTITITSTTIEIQPMSGATMTIGNDVSLQIV